MRLVKARCVFLNEIEFIERQVSSEQIFEGRVLSVFKDEVMLPDGSLSLREYCKHIGAVCIIPILPDGRVIMERQYRYAHGRVFFEIPAGKLDSSDEEPLSAALRELREETGAVANKVTFLGCLDTTPALIDEKIHMYMAEDLTFSECELDDDEFLRTELCPLKTLYEMVMSGQIRDAKTQIAVLKAAALRPEYMTVDPSNE